MKWFIKCLKQYSDFEGRARRTEYWMYFLFNSILGCVLTFSGSMAFYWVYVLVMLTPGLAVTVRRLHDIGKSGWWFFISLIPIIGGIWLIVLNATDSQPGENKYGPNPDQKRLDCESER